MIYEVTVCLRIARSLIGPSIPRKDGGSPQRSVFQIRGGI